MRVAILDYGVGNLHSLARALAAGGAEVTIEASAPNALRADALVLPGVGAFAAAAERIAPFVGDIRGALEDGLPALGICLGMQLLFDRSDEGGGAGIGLIPGTVGRLRARPVPHMGWNDVAAADAAEPLFAELPEMTMYYANSFAVRPADPAAVLAWTEYDTERFPAVVGTARTRGVQFHPEKSGPAGLRLIRNFLSSVDR